VRKIQPKEYAEAISTSLINAGYAAHAKEKYTLDASLLSVSNPAPGFSQTVTCEARYQLTNINTGEKVYDETIKESYTTEFEENSSATERWKLSTARAIRETITHMMIKMASSVK